jgi:hypothetical protein
MYFRAFHSPGRLRSGAGGRRAQELGSCKQVLRAAGVQQQASSPYRLRLHRFRFLSVTAPSSHIAHAAGPLQQLRSLRRPWAMMQPTALSFALLIALAACVTAQADLPGTSLRGSSDRPDSRMHLRPRGTATPPLLCNSCLPACSAPHPAPCASSRPTSGSLGAATRTAATARRGRPGGGALQARSACPSMEARPTPACWQTMTACRISANR